MAGQEWAIRVQASRVEAQFELACGSRWVIGLLQVGLSCRLGHQSCVLQAGLLVQDRFGPWVAGWTRDTGYRQVAGHVTGHYHWTGLKPALAADA